MTTTTTKTTATNVTDPRAARGVRRRAGRHPPARHRRPRRGGRGRTSAASSRRSAQLRGRRPRAVLPAAGLAARRRRAERLQDPRQHGDRPQRHARPVRLDGRPRPELADVRVGHRLPRASSGSTRHNYIHHTYTNILGKDRDIGYGILRMDEDQPWHPYYLGNPVYAFLLMVFFEWGVALHDLEVENIVAGKRTWTDNKPLLPGHDAQGPQPGAQGLRAVPGADRAAVPADPRRQRDRQPGPQRLGVQHHLLRPLPGRRRDVHRGGDRGRDRAGTGTTASCSARPTSPAASCSTS